MLIVINLIFEISRSRIIGEDVVSAIYHVRISPILFRDSYIVEVLRNLNGVIYSLQLAVAPTYFVGGLLK